MTCLSCQELPAPRKGLDRYSKNDDRCPWDQKLAKVVSSSMIFVYCIYIYICILHSICLKFILSSEVAKFKLVGIFVYSGVDLIELGVCPLPSHEATAFGGLLWRSFICIKLCKHPTFQDFNGFSDLTLMQFTEWRHRFLRQKRSCCPSGTAFMLTKTLC